MVLALICGCDAQVDPSYQGNALITISGEVGQVEAPLSAEGGTEVGILWLQTTEDPVRLYTHCEIELSDEVASPCVAACGVPSCDNLEKLRAWQGCASSCEGPDGVASISLREDTATEIAGAVGQTVAVEGQFPAQFRLALLHPPADSVLIQMQDGGRFALGAFVALDPAGAPFDIRRDGSGIPPWLKGASESHLLMFAPDGARASSDLGRLAGFAVDPGYQLVAVDRALAVEEGDGATFLPAPASEETRVQLRVADPATIRWPFECGDREGFCSFAAAFE